MRIFEIYNYLILLHYLLITYFWVSLELVFLCVWIYFIRKFPSLANTSAWVGLTLLFFVMIFILIGNDIIAGKIAEVALIFFFIAAIHSFILDKKTNEK